MSTYIPVFTSPEGKTEVLSAYDAIMDKWPVAYKELTLSTRFGETHVIVSGPEGAKPVVLLHALLASAIGSARKLIPHVEVQVIPDAHHVTAVAQPEKVNQRLLQFFEQP
jgi:hypothetical protein